MTSNSVSEGGDGVLFVICSVINTGDAPWSYSSIRSYQSPEERFSQTLKTIESIRTKCPLAKILISECSSLSEQQEFQLRAVVDMYIQSYGDVKIRSICLLGNKKGHGEVVLMRAALKYIQDKEIEFDRLLKISGRYFLNDFFDLQQFSSSTFTFNKKFKKGTTYPTVLYGVPFLLKSQYSQVLDRCMEHYEGPHCTGLEALLPPMCTPATYVACVGVCGYVSQLHNNFYSPTPSDVD